MRKTQIELFLPHSGVTKWENYIAHGLTWHSQAPEAHVLGEGGYYRLTELGKVMASRVVDPKRRAEIQQLIGKASAAKVVEEKRPPGRDYQISRVKTVLDDVNETAMEIATNQEADAEALINHIEELTAALRTMWPRVH